MHKYILQIFKNKKIYLIEDCRLFCYLKKLYVIGKLISVSKPNIFFRLIALFIDIVYYLHLICTYQQYLKSNSSTNYNLYYQSLPFVFILYVGRRQSCIYCWWIVVNLVPKKKKKSLPSCISVLCKYFLVVFRYKISILYDKHIY